MSTIIVRGGKPLSGSVCVEGSKNAVLPILAATLLGDTPSVIHNVPRLEDVFTILDLLGELGVTLWWEDQNTVKADPRGLICTQAPNELVRRMRASLLVLGPLLARRGSASSCLPGGCAIGTRPIDLHLKGFIALGASLCLSGGELTLRSPGLSGTHIYLDFPSVTATENIMMAACLAKGVTIIENAAEEPEVMDLANFLASMGAKIAGAGSSVIRIEGVPGLQGARHTVMPDRIEVGTYLVAGAIAGGSVRVERAVPEHMKAVLAKLEEAGASVLDVETGLQVQMCGRSEAADVKTLPYPGFPTDMQAPFMALLTTAQGTSIITETVFENRFMHVGELKRMGARIKIEGRTAIVEGVQRLSGASVRATDLRAGAALILAALGAEGRTEVGCAEHIQRGYSRLPEKLKALGADIECCP